jgi:hypothetical protein
MAGSDKTGIAGDVILNVLLKDLDLRVICDIRDPSRVRCSENVIPSVLTRDLGTKADVTCHPRFFAEYRSE